MTESLHTSFVFEAFVGDAFVEQQSPNAGDIVATLKRSDAWHEASIRPKDSTQFPWILMSFHGKNGFVVQCFEDEKAWSHFLVVSDQLSAPAVEVELGGQALERWPPERFVPEDVALAALDWFLDFGKQKPGLRWVRIDRFPREVLWDDRANREAWERARKSQGRDA